MKYGIMTYYGVHNHGALLQLNGMVKVLKKNFNIEAHALQFDRNYDYIDRELRNKFVLSLKSVGVYCKYLKKNGLSVFMFNVKKKGLFEDFKKRENLVGDFYSDSEQLDGIVVGSDEVFSLEIGITPVLFGHSLPSNKVFAYAGCFGSTTQEDVKRKHCEAIVASGLNSMAGLAMRDQNSIDIAKELTGRDSVKVVDPVILYGYKDELAGFTRPTNMPEKYLLVYAYENRFNDQEEAKAVLDYAHSHSMKVVCPGFCHKWADINVNVDPVELLRYFKYADCVITDTFHGAVMSIITGREIGVKIRDNKNKLFNLLKEYGLAERVIGEDWNIESVFSKKLDCDFVVSEVERRRAESMAYLKKMVEL
jgi:Polysaccharide pyruvyl transferase.